LSFDTACLRGVISNRKSLFPTNQLQTLPLLLVQRDGTFDGSRLCAE